MRQLADAVLAACRFSDNEKLKPASGFTPIEYPKLDNKICFDLNTSLFRWAGW